MLLLLTMTVFGWTLIIPEHWLHPEIAKESKKLIGKDEYLGKEDCANIMAVEA